MRIAYANLIDSATIDSYSGASSNYPANNLQNQILGTEWRTISIATGQYVIFDAGTSSTFTCNCCFISAHNLQNSATIRFQMHTTNDFTTPDFSQTITWRSGHMYAYFASTTKRYIRFYFEDTTNPDAYISVGRVFAGVYLQITPSSMLPFKVSNIRDDQITEVETGGLFGTPGQSRRKFSLEFPNTTDTMIESIRTVYDTVGHFKPLYFCDLDSTFTHHDICYCRIVNDFEENILGAKQNTYSLELKEVN